MADKKVITLRKLREKEAEGWCFADYEEYYGRTEDEMKEEIRKLYKSKTCAEKLIKEIAQNDKHKDKKARSSKDFDTQEQVEQDERNYVETEIIDSLKEREQELDSKAKKQHTEANRFKKQLASERKNEKSISKEIGEIEEQLKVKRAEAGRCQDRIAELKKKIEKAEKAEAAAKAELKTVQAEIVKLMVITLRVTEDGEITPYEMELDIVLDDSGWEGFYQEFGQRAMSDEIYAGFSFGSGMALAKAFSIALNSKSQIQVVSDIPGFEKAFSELVKEL